MKRGVRKSKKKIKRVLRGGEGRKGEAILQNQPKEWKWEGQVDGC